jgi:hypothetical protein
VTSLGNFGGVSRVSKGVSVMYVGCIIYTVIYTVYGVYQGVYKKPCIPGCIQGISEAGSAGTLLTVTQDPST